MKMNNLEGPTGLFIEKLLKIKNNSYSKFKEYIPLSQVYSSLCPQFSITKSRLREILIFMSNRGILKIISNNKIKLTLNE